MSNTTTNNGISMLVTRDADEVARYIQSLKRQLAEANARIEELERAIRKAIVMFFTEGSDSKCAVSMRKILDDVIWAMAAHNTL